MNSIQDRVLVTVAATSLLAAGGMVAGYFVGRHLTVEHAESSLEPYARKILAQSDSAVTESRATLATISASKFEPCSDAEIGWLRQLVYQTQYIKESGRMSDGRITCSTTLGRPEKTIALPKPDFSRADGTRVYRDFAPFHIPGQHVLTVQLGGAFIVYNPYPLQGTSGSAMHLTLTGIDKAGGESGHVIGDSPQVAADSLTQDGETRAADRMYVTRCSASRFGCITASISIPEALQANRAEFHAYIASGCLGGALFGLAISFFYRRNKAIEMQLRRAIRREALGVVYQPIVELPSGRIVGAEALARWTDEDGFNVGPDVFIPIAEERGFVGDITRLVIKRCLRDFGKAMQTIPGFRVNINITPTDLANPRFLRLLERYIRWAEVPASSLGIEITESGTAGHELAREAISVLHQRGHVVHIDDFGTGYSSLARLNDLAIDVVKIDRAFTKAIGTEAVTVSIMPQILAMAETLNLQVIAEGIETPEQAGYFSIARRPILAQGWLFGRPVSAEDFHLKLAENAERFGAREKNEEETQLALPASAS
jgi:sensor c-di-GMP phosphodiesterase-like protein